MVEVFVEDCWEKELSITKASIHKCKLDFHAWVKSSFFFSGFLMSCMTFVSVLFVPKASLCHGYMKTLPIGHKDISSTTFYIVGPVAADIDQTVTLTFKGSNDHGLIMGGSLPYRIEMGLGF